MLTGDRLPTIPTHRLRLRWLEDSDARDLFVVFSDPVVVKYFGLTRMRDLAESKELVRHIQSSFREHSLYQWGVELVSEGRIVGTCTLSHLDPRNRRAELGFAIGRGDQRKGYATEAVQALIAFAFGELAMHRLEADVDPRNKPSIRRLEALGFQREGYLRERWLNDGEIQDTVLYGLLAREWGGQTV
jgi:RimJ/RimL family protein N-acetyltransferase